MTAAKNALSGDESDSENENAVTDSEDEDQAYQNLVDKDENLINQVRTKNKPIMNIQSQNI